MRPGAEYARELSSDGKGSHSYDRDDEIQAADDIDVHGSSPESSAMLGHFVTKDNTKLKVRTVVCDTLSAKCCFFEMIYHLLLASYPGSPLTDTVYLGAALAGKARRYIPFGEGPRNCLGQALARTMLPVLLATLLSQHKFVLAPEARLQQAEGLVGIHPSAVFGFLLGQNRTVGEQWLLLMLTGKPELQAGGPQGVHAAEVTSLITGTKEGISMKVLPRY